MKATLKHVDNQYILIVDERPKIGNWYINTAFFNPIIFYKSKNDFQHFEHKIIAAENINGVKGIRIEYNNHLLKSKQSRIREMLDGKEVQVTECKDYWLVRL